jgi:hypothetical protein
MARSSLQARSYVFICYRNIHKEINITLTERANFLPDFSIDYEKCDAIIEKKEKRDRNGEVIYEYYPSVTFYIGLFRHPGPIIYTLFLPMFLLSVFNSVIYFTNQS